MTSIPPDSELREAEEAVRRMAACVTGCEGEAVGGTTFRFDGRPRCVVSRRVLTLLSVVVCPALGAAGGPLLFWLTPPLALPG